MTTPLTIEAIRECWSKATPGPWAAQCGHTDSSALIVSRGPVNGLLVAGDVQEDWDAQAIAAAPEHIAFLLAEAERANERTHAKVSELHSIITDLATSSAALRSERDAEIARLREILESVAFGEDCDTIGSRKVYLDGEPARYLRHAARHALGLDCGDYE